MTDPAHAYRYLQERLGVDVKSTAPATELASLGVDSLSLLEMVFEIEERFGVKVDEDTPPPKSCGELVALIERLAAAKP
jgi:acyl carrier protein